MGTLFSTRVRVAAAFALALGVFAAINVSPAAATRAHAAASSTFFCNTSTGLVTNLYSLAQPASGARGEMLGREPDTGSPIEVPDAAKGKGGKGFGASVPVYFHVVHDGPLADLTTEQINAQIRVMNAGFSGAEGGYDTGFRFKLAGVTRTDNAAWLHHGYGDKYEREMKRALHQGGRAALNIYATDAAGYLGWAYFPNLSDSRLYLDGIVVDWQSMPGTSTNPSYVGRYDLGKTATHEAGHWINLYHVFQGGCNNWGDYVEDTPAQLVATFGCPEGQDSCSEPGLDSIHNYMDYSFDSCYTQFTKGQAARMQDAWLYYRANG